MSDTAVFDLPVIDISSSDEGGAFSLPVITLVAEGEMALSFATIQLPVLTLVSSGITGDSAEAEFDLPMLTLEVVALQNGLGTTAFSLPVVNVDSVGLTGGYGTAAFSLPVVTLSIAAYQSIIGTASFNLPVLILSSRDATAALSAYRTWVLNTRKEALTEYNNFSFNSFAVFNNQVLACGPSGVVVLGTQSLDGATQITAKFRTGMDEFESGWVKRVPRLYLDGSQSDDMLVRVITTEGGTRTYTLLTNNITGHQQRRVPIGKGIKSRWFQFECENVNGGDFSAQSLIAYPTKLRRRIAG